MRGPLERMLGAERRYKRELLRMAKGLNSEIDVEV